MPVQTTEKGYIYFPDGAKVSVKESGAGSYTDIGAINSAIAVSLAFEENSVRSANAGELPKQIRYPTMTGSFTLINLNPENINRMGGGAMTISQQTGTTVIDANITDQSISGYTAGVPVELRPVVTATGNVLKFSTTPVITSVTASVSGVLAVNNDYILVVDPESTSGYSILFNGSGTATVGTSETITVDFGDNDPVTGYYIKGGSSTTTLTAYALKFTHTDDSSDIDRELELFAVDTNSDGFNFNFKGANEDGVEEMPVTFTAKLDTSLTSGQQLYSYFSKQPS